jgi:hypothetical protein
MLYVLISDTRSFLCVFKTPSQLLTTPHPKRLTLVELERATLIQSFKENEKSIIEETFKIHAHYFHPLHQSGTNSPPILYISNYHNKVRKQKLLCSCLIYLCDMFSLSSS